MTSKIVDVLLEEIKRRGYTIARFSKETGVPDERLYQWKRGKGSPKQEDFEKIQNWLKSENRERDLIAAHSALLSVIVSELASVISRDTGEHPALIVKRIYKAAEDVGKIDG